MIEFNVWYDGMIIDHVFAASAAEVQKLYSSPIVAAPVNASKEEHAAAKEKSLNL